MKKDLSILIVHYNTPGLLKQTLKGIVQSAQKMSYEVVVVDNNPALRVKDWIQKLYPEVKLVVSPENVGFGRGMNLAMQQACGRYFFVYNPDIATFDHVFDQLVSYLDAHPEVGMVAPQLLNPDRSLQYSCFRFMKPAIVAYRRVPVLRSLSFARKAVEDYQMKDWGYNEVKEVDYVLGAAMCVRKEAVDQVGGFDPAFKMYFEEQDWCRRFWLQGWRVVYHPQVQLVHYYRRETAEGSFVKQLRNPLTRIQLQSALYYFKKYRGQPNPRHARSDFSSST